MPIVRVAGRAKKDMQRLPPQYFSAVVKALRGLADAPLDGKPLHGEFEGLRSLRVGTYRVVYRFDVATGFVEVAWIRHRSEVYRRAR